MRIWVTVAVLLLSVFAFGPLGLDTDAADQPVRILNTDSGSVFSAVTQDGCQDDCQFCLYCRTCGHCHSVPAALVAALTLDISAVTSVQPDNYVSVALASASGPYRPPRA